MRIKSDYHTNGQLMEYIRHTESNVADIYKLRFFICLLDRGLIDCFNVLLFVNLCIYILEFRISKE
ncbi:hypothetical protein K410107C12_00900 [Agathobacter rectalis]